MSGDYKTATIQIVVSYKIGWDETARQDAIDFALQLPITGGGAGSNGCYRAERDDVSLLTQPSD